MQRVNLESNQSYNNTNQSLQKSSQTTISNQTSEAKIDSKLKIAGGGRKNRKERSGSNSRGRMVDENSENDQ